MNKQFNYFLKVNALKIAYIAACGALKIANKLKNKASSKKHRSRIMGNLNRIRAELNRVEKLNVYDVKPVLSLVKSEPAKSMAYGVMKRWGAV